MIVNGCDLEAAFDHFGHDRIDFGFEKNEIAHNHCAAGRWLKGDPSAQGQGGLDRDAIERHGKIGTRKTVAMHVVRPRTFSSKSRLHPLTIALLSTSGNPYQ